VGNRVPGLTSALDAIRIGRAVGHDRDQLPAFRTVAEGHEDLRGSYRTIIPQSFRDGKDLLAEEADDDGLPPHVEVEEGEEGVLQVRHIIGSVHGYKSSS
jgi:hypothetical protein